MDLETHRPTVRRASAVLGLAGLCLALYDQPLGIRLAATAMLLVLAATALQVSRAGGSHMQESAGDLDPFVAEDAGAPVADRVLTTVMFTDIVRSTERAATLGDLRWRCLLARHDQLVRGELERYGGREVKTLGDGFLATFDSPAQAIRCAHAITDGLALWPIDVRTGLNTGECDVVGGDVVGLAVHLAARIGALARAQEVLVSATVKDLVLGSGITFGNRGKHRIKGVPGRWHLFRVESIE